MSLFICPICGLPLTSDEKLYSCPSLHCFDKAREGYVHLLPPNKKNSKDPGDDKNMVQARTRFLSQGFYAHLRNTLEALCVDYAPFNAAILDSGCGEAYYTEGLLTALETAGKAPRLAGIDISKSAVRLGAKRMTRGELAVASAYHLPIADSSIDIILNCFSPLSEAEFLRVLKPTGRFIYVVPAPLHLWELKSALYDKPYENQRISPEYTGFKLINTVSISKTIKLANNQSIEDLFAMTPYFWKTPAQGRVRLATLNELEVQAAFDIYVYEKQ